MTPPRCFLQIRGRWFALMNWQARSTRADSVVLRALNSDEEALLLSWKQADLDEAYIFARLFPPSAEETFTRNVSLPITMLTKTQLSYLIENKIGVTIPSLKHMKKEDLMRLFGRL